ncbi:hypothetical protein Ga0100231_001595 [Opitutaceae bacterium TAV4]|nr:hypothetical protein Ga0100230_007735 [Opitutaceae bacterium TAV3]RRK01512.1 hypothetical protein Ga0100231_001595 [Opitutaceae bacterium TAV4]
MKDSTVSSTQLHRAGFRFVALLVALISTAAAAISGIADDIPGFEIGKDGRFRMDGLEAKIGHFDAEWKHTDQSRLNPASGYPRIDPASKIWQIRGDISVKTTTPAASTLLTIAEQFSPAPSGSAREFHLTCRVAEADPTVGIPTRETSLQINLPVTLTAGRAIRFDSETHILPVELGKSQLLTRPAAHHTLALPATTGTVIIEGNFALILQDQRQWQGRTYTARLRFSPPPGQDKRLPSGGSSLDVTIRHVPFQSEPIPLRSVANRAFRDTIAGDNQGGWTDQGPDNDLSPMKPGRLIASGIEFDIVDPATNGGRSALVLGKDGQPGLPRTATLEFPSPHQTSPASANEPWRNLYLLHAAAWLGRGDSPVGNLAVRYQDGTETRHKIAAGRDVGNWWIPASSTNAAVGWGAQNGSAAIGLYVSRFAIEPKPLAGICFETAGPSMWMIAGLSASPDEIPLFEVKFPLTIDAGPDWAPYEHSVEIEPGGVFDLSLQTEDASGGAPAGKHGPIRATPEGHFEFTNRPGHPVRFWGVNLCFSANYLQRDEADRLAERLARSGYNTVRLHHFDQDLVRPGGRSHELDPKKLDQFDYLFAAMKKRGLYLNIDLFTNRRFHADELAAFRLPATLGGSQTRALFKALVPISEPAYQAWAQFAQNLLAHPNPYTGLTWAQDPALIGICPVNEDSLINRIGDAAIRDRYEAAFAASRSAPDGETREQRAAAFNQFVHETEIRADARLFAFLRSLGVKAILTGANHKLSQGLAFVRQHYDYVDNHQYWDHPRFPGVQWKPPFSFTQADPVRDAAGTPRGLMPTRILGLPFVVTEFNYVRPNRHRASGGLLMPAYASLQDWDALYNFEYAMSRSSALNGGASGTFSIADDPIGLIADRVSALLFLRRDIALATTTFAYAVQPAEAYVSREHLFPRTFSQLGLVARIGSLPGLPADVLRTTKAAAAISALPSAAGASGKTNNNPVYAPGDDLAANLQRDGILPTGSIDATGKRFVSETGQIELRADEGTAQVITPRSELFVLTSGAHLAGATTTVKNGPTPVVVSIIAIDGQSLAQSHRLLVTHLTDSLSTGMRFAHHDRKLLENWGRAPHLVQRGTSTLTLRLADGNWKAWAVDATGKRQREVPLIRDAGASGSQGAWTLEAATITGTNTQLAYELAR